MIAIYNEAGVRRVVEFPLHEMKEWIAEIPVRAKNCKFYEIVEIKMEVEVIVSIKG